MSEMKRNFSGGKMNRDLDERLVKPGEYRRANNIEVSTSEGSNVGSLQSVMGNTEKTNGVVTSYLAAAGYENTNNPSCVGVIADEKNDKIYSLIHNPGKFFIGSSEDDTQHGFVDQDFILEYDVSNDTYKYVFVDNYNVEITLSAQTNSGSAVLTFSNNKYVRNGMTATWLDSAGNFNTATVRNTFATGTTNYSSTIVTLDEVAPANIATNTLISFRNERALDFEPYRKITGINIIDDLLFWTDNHDEPKKINITRSLHGTGGAQALPASVFLNHNGDNTDFQTRIYGEFEPLKNIQCKLNDAETMPRWAELEHITVIRRAPKTPPTLEMSSEKAGRRNTSTGIVNPTSSTYTGTHQVGGTNVVAGDNITLTVDSACDWRDGDILLVVDEQPTDPTNFTDYLIRYKVINGVSNPNNLLTTFTLQVEAISSTSPLSTSSTQYWFNLERPEALFTTKFPRFGYRYKYADGEYSPFSPWSQPAFLMEGFDYEPKKGYNLGMVNNIRHLVIKDYLVESGNFPQDVIEVDLLYKEDSSPTVYTIKTLSRNDYSAVAPDNLIWPDLSLTNKARGEFEIKSEMIHAVVPSNQMLRPWDNVPRKALAQEVTGNRVVYGNYVQNYDVSTGAGKEIKPNFNITVDSTSLPYDGKSPAKSVKTIRNYNLGIVYCDRFGRETPVLTDKKSGSFYLEKEHCAHQNKIVIQNLHQAPSWATHYKYYIKETSNEYYNLAMDRWYNAEDGNIWISFPSSERNKLDIDTYLILKKKHGSDDPVTDKARYKILAIEPDAPDFIKINRLGLGTAPSSNFLASGYPLPDLTYVYVSQSGLDAAYGVDASGVNDLAQFAIDGELYFRSVVPNGDASDWYKVTKISSIVPDPNDTSQNYYDIKVDGKFGTDMDITSTGNSFATAVSHSMEFKREIIEERPEFDGRFFVKIYRDLVLEENVLGASPASSYSVIMSRRIYHVKNGIAFDDNNNPPDNYRYWDGTAETGYNSTGSGGYVGTPYTEAQGQGSYDDQETADEDKFKKYNGKWVIDNCMAAYGGAGRGVHRDQQGHTYGGYGAYPDRNNDSSRITGAGNRSGQSGRSGTGNSAVGNIPGDVYRGGTGNSAHNVMHLSKMGIRPTDTDIMNIEGNVDEIDDWGWVQLCNTVGARFRWREDPDKQVYEIIRTEKQLGIRNFESSSGNAKYDNTSNKRARWSIKFEPLNQPGEGFGTTTTHGFHPIVNAVDETGAAIVTQDRQANNRPYNFAGLHHNAKNYLTMEFVDVFDASEDETKEYLSNPAIWETEPKEDVGLDIYYEMGPTYPMNMTADTNEMLIPFGSCFYKGGTKYFVTSWSDTTMTFDNEAINSGAAAPSINFADNETIEIETSYGGIVYVVVDGAQNGVQSVLLHGGENGSFQQHSQPTSPAWWNCVAFGNGVESDRIRDGFNLTQLANGVKASTTVATPYREERRKSGLIYSGIYNSTSGVNDTNQFIMAEKITKDLNPDYGSIQKLYTRETNLLTLCEDKVLKVQANKDALFNADGNTNVTASSNVLGQAIPITGDYGISTNPESFAAYATNCYFTDAVRGSVMQMRGDALAPISQIGMSDHFADLLKQPSRYRCIGSYDEKKSNYNLYINRKNFKVKNGGLYSQETITYSEKSKGWSSFKTFYPEQGISLNNKYYTWQYGSMWEHHTNSVHCSFYGNTPGSSDFASVNIMFNDMPTAVKSYNTMNYEGTQAKIDQFITTTISGVTYDDGEYYNLAAKKGWYCKSIVSDLQEGEVPEFKNKEGKWFNAIHGVETSLSNLDQTEFTVQGIGYATTITASDNGVANNVDITSEMTLAGDSNKVALDTNNQVNTIASTTNLNTLSHVYNLTLDETHEDLKLNHDDVVVTGQSASATTSTSSTYTSGLPSGIAQAVVANVGTRNDKVSITITWSSGTTSTSTSYAIPITVNSLSCEKVPFCINIIRPDDDRYEKEIDRFLENQPANTSLGFTYTEVAVSGTTYAASDNKAIGGTTARKASGEVCVGERTKVAEFTIEAASNKYLFYDNAYEGLMARVRGKRRRKRRFKEIKFSKYWDVEVTPVTIQADGLVTKLKYEVYYTSPELGHNLHTKRNGETMTTAQHCRKVVSVIFAELRQKDIKTAIADEITGFSFSPRVRLNKDGGVATIYITGNQEGAGCKVNVQRSSDNKYYNFNNDSFQTAAAPFDITVDAKKLKVLQFLYGATTSADITYTVWLEQNSGGDAIKTGLPISSSKFTIVQRHVITITLQPSTTASDFGTMPAALSINFLPRTITKSKRPVASDEDKYYDYSKEELQDYDQHEEQYEYYEFDFTITPSTSRVISILQEPNLKENDYDIVKSGTFKTAGAEGTLVDIEVTKVLNEGNNARIYGYLKVGNISPATSSPLALTFRIDNLIT